MRRTRSSTGSVRFVPLSSLRIFDAYGMLQLTSCSEEYQCIRHGRRLKTPTSMRAISIWGLLFRPRHIAGIAKPSSLHSRDMAGLSMKPDTMRSYEDALAVIESRQRRSRPTGKSSKPDAPAKPSASGTPGLRGTPSIQGMSEWLHMLGYSV